MSIYVWLGEETEFQHRTHEHIRDLIGTEVIDRLEANPTLTLDDAFATVRQEIEAAVEWGVEGARHDYEMGIFDGYEGGDGD